MALDYFLKVKDVKGEAQAEGHKEEIEIMSWSMGASNPGSFGVGSGGGTGKVSLSDISISMKSNKASPKLFQACATGKHIDEAILFCRKSGGDAKPYDYLKVTLNHVLVSSFQTGGSGGNDIPIDSISLNFGKITYDYFVQDTSKGTVASAGAVTYDLTLAQAAG